MDDSTPQAKFLSLSRAGLLLTGLLPCLVSAGFHVAGPMAQPMEPEPARPALAFDQYAVNLGPLKPISHAKARFRFTNSSDRPVQVTKLLPSCGCLKPRLDKKDYAPGEEGEFTVQVATAGEQPGPRTYTIIMQYLDPEPQSVTLTFRMDLPPRQVYVTPRALLFYQFSQDGTSKTIHVTDNRDKPLTVTGVECRAEFVTATIGETAEADGVQTTKIHVAVDAVPLGSHQAVVKIFTNDPRFPVLGIPLQVHRQPPIPGLRGAAPKPQQAK